MTLLTVVKDVCAAVGVLLPQSIFSGITGNRTMQEMVALANEMAQRIAYDTREWTTLKQQQVYTGNDLQTAFDLPANFKRMLLVAEVWRSTSTQQPMQFIPDANEWMRRRAAAQTDAWGEWTMMGGQMQIYPALGAGETASFAYLDKNCVTLAGGGFGDQFMADGDSYRLDERVLKLGMTWQWKAQKGSPYTEDLGTYGDALAYVSGADSPAPILIGRLPLSNARTAYPYGVPTG